MPNTSATLQYRQTPMRVVLDRQLLTLMSALLLEVRHSPECSRQCLGPGGRKDQTRCAV